MEKNRHNVFIGWSGERSRTVAAFLRSWISQVVQAAKPWMSDVDIQKGSRWFEEVSMALGDMKVGITCLTPENLQNPWVLFEAGAVSKVIGERTRLCTLLIGELKPQDVASPLGMFQATTAQRDDVLKLVRTINLAVSDQPLQDRDLEAIFDAMWPKFEEMLRSLPASEEAAPAKRSVEDMVAEILDIVRTDDKRGGILSGVSTTLSPGTPVTHGISE